ncbi:putative LuxR family transcriptional regulator [Rhodococcus sp. RD6.2]|uniref:LuxR family transcriptional regulator n=1 Tax=Rhodococcus sp. RD6.2 TaxID=260936 RepID=UPI00063B6739|nr:LuxR family transcriptional regulator [Rhodococcus sp. RD6.2]CRK51263.1 putative LuxR family transcriptional regulator [Rhodococcus sp. RD6.2]
MVSAGLPGRRARLLPRLDEAPQTVLWGPRGYGKTTLVETWLAEQPDSTVIRVEVPDPGTATEQYWSDLTERMSADTGVLVLDRPDRLCDATTWERLHTIRAAHRGLRVLVSIRESTLLESVPISDPNLTIVPAGELEFTEAEVADLLAHRAVSSPQRTARDLWRTTGGHPALVAIAESVIRVFGSDLDFERERAYLAVRVQIDRYVEGMLLEDPGIGDMARTIAVLRRPSPDALALLGVDDAAGTLSGLEHAGLLRRMPAAPDTYWTWPTALRRSVLRIVERDAVAPSRSASATLARWFADRGEPVEALRHATDGQDWDLLLAILTTEWPTIVTTGLGVLVRALHALPESEAQANPAVQYARLLVAGAGLTAGTPGHVRGPLPDISVTETADRDSAELALLTGTLRLCVQRWNGDYDAAVRDRDTLVTLANRMNESGGLDRRWLSAVWMHLGLASQLRVGDRRTVELLTHAVDCGIADPGNFAARQAAGHLALHHAVLGEPERTAHWLGQESRFGERAGWIRALVERPAIIARALQQLDRLDVPPAEAALDELDELDDEADEADELQAFVVYVRSQLDLIQGRSEVGLGRVDRSRHRLRRRLGPTAAAGPLLTAALMDLHTATGQAARVLECARLADGPMHPMMRLAAARAAMCAGDHTAATALCTPLTGHRVSETRVRLEAQLIMATLAHEQGRDHDARIAWNRATAMSLDSGLVRPLLTVPPTIREALTAGGAAIPFSDRLAGWGDGPFPRPAPPVTLTEREAAVLDGLTRGGSVAQIAESLFVSPNTVKSQLNSLYRKLGVHSREGAVLEAARRGLGSASPVRRSSGRTP